MAMATTNARMVPQKLNCTCQNPLLEMEVGGDSARMVRDGVLRVEERRGIYIVARCDVYEGSDVTSG